LCLGNIRRRLGTGQSTQEFNHVLPPALEVPQDVTGSGVVFPVHAPCQLIRHPFSPLFFHSGWKRERKTLLDIRKTSRM
jgi:hypothetical protein